MAICAGCNAVNPWAGFVIGLVAGLVFMLWSFMIEKLRIDDPLDAVAGITRIHNKADLRFVAYRANMAIVCLVLPVSSTPFPCFKNIWVVSKMVFGDVLN